MSRTGLPAANVRLSTAPIETSEDVALDKKAKTPKKPKQTKPKTGADRAK
jgi:hypothetical protein